MIINIERDEQIAAAIKMARTYRTVCGLFVIAINGVVVIRIRWMKD